MKPQKPPKVFGFFTKIIQRTSRGSWGWAPVGLRSGWPWVWRAAWAPVGRSGCPWGWLRLGFRLGLGLRLGPTWPGHGLLRSGRPWGPLKLGLRQNSWAQVAWASHPSIAQTHCRFVTVAPILHDGSASAIGGLPKAEHTPPITGGVCSLLPGPCCVPASVLGNVNLLCIRYTSRWRPSRSDRLSQSACLEIFLRLPSNATLRSSADTASPVL